MDFLKNFGLNLQTENGKKLELKGLPGVIALGLFTIIAIVILKSIFIGFFVFVYSVIGFLFSPVGIGLIIILAIFIGIDQSRRETFLGLVRKYSSKGQADDKDFSSIDESLGRGAFEDKKD